MIPSSPDSLPRFSFRLLACLLLSLFAFTAAAQSGRRSVPGSPSVTPPAPPADAKETVKTAEPKDEKRLEIIVTSDRDTFSAIPLYFYDTVLRSCAGRLDDARGVKVDAVSKQTSRGDAIKTAKAQKEAYVVWLQLRSDNMSRDVSNGDLSNINLEYIVYEPMTAKVKAQGTCYQGAYKAGGVVVGPQSTGGSNPTIAESRLKYAAQDAGDQILKALHLVLPSDLPPH